MSERNRLREDGMYYCARCGIGLVEHAGHVCGSCRTTPTTFDPVLPDGTQIKTVCEVCGKPAEVLHINGYRCEAHYWVGHSTTLGRMFRGPK